MRDKEESNNDDTGAVRMCLLRRMLGKQRIYKKVLTEDVTRFIDQKRRQGTKYMGHMSRSVVELGREKFSLSVGGSGSGVVSPSNHFGTELENLLIVFECWLKIIKS